MLLTTRSASIRAAADAILGLRRLVSINRVHPALQYGTTNTLKAAELIDNVKAAEVSRSPIGSLWYNVNGVLLDALQELGIRSPSAVQATAIPAICSGEDVLLQAATGTGKTLAYLLPLAQRLKAEEEASGAISRPGRPRVLVIVPTRELANQVTRVAKSLGHTVKLSAAAYVGGQAESRHKELLSRPIDILVGTPGVLAGALSRHTLSLSDVRTCVIDEADTLLDDRVGVYVGGAGRREGSVYSLRRRDAGERGRPVREGRFGPGSKPRDALDPKRGFLPDLEALLKPLRATEAKAEATRVAMLDGREADAHAASSPAPTRVQFVLVGATMPVHALRSMRRLFPRIRPASEVALEVQGPLASRPPSSLSHMVHAPPPALQHVFMRVGADPEAKHVALMEALGAALQPGTHLQYYAAGEGEGEARPLRPSRAEKDKAALAVQRVLVFCNTVQSARSTSYFLGEQGYSVACLHGAIPPNLRQAEYAMFLSGKAPVLVATDAAARGLDVPGLATVILFDFPLNAVEYLHRAGRAGRAGAVGKAVSIVGPGDGVLATALEKAAGAGAGVQDWLGLTGDKGTYSPNAREVGKGRGEGGDPGPHTQVMFTSRPRPVQQDRDWDRGTGPAHDARPGPRLSRWPRAGPRPGNSRPSRTGEWVRSERREGREGERRRAFPSRGTGTRSQRTSQ